MGRAFEYRKARKLKRWGHMARTFTKIGKEIELAVIAGGPDPSSNLLPTTPPVPSPTSVPPLYAAMESLVPWA